MSSWLVIVGIQLLRTFLPMTAGGEVDYDDIPFQQWVDNTSWSINKLSLIPRIIGISQIRYTILVPIPLYSGPFHSAMTWLIFKALISDSVKIEVLVRPHSATLFPLRVLIFLRTTLKGFQAFPQGLLRHYMYSAMK